MFQFPLLLICKKIRGNVVFPEMLFGVEEQIVV